MDSVKRLEAYLAAEEAPLDATSRGRALWVAVQMNSLKETAIDRARPLPWLVRARVSHVDDSASDKIARGRRLAAA